jgi:hypothetical protein
MIDFRCWYCNRRHRASKDRIGERITCHCGYPLRVPPRSGGNCRVKTLLDWLVEAVVYGGGCALLGLGIDALLFSRLHIWLVEQYVALFILAAIPLAGFLFGFLGGERAVGWLVRAFRGQR